MTQQELYHFIGIGGIGMSGLAKILLSRGQKVAGSDMSSSYVTEALQSQGATVHIGHSETYIKPHTTVIYNSDIPASNPEIMAARKYACKLLHRSDLLLELMEKHKVLAISGTHGKTTTTGLLTHVLKTAGWDPAFMVGGMIKGIDVNASDGKSEYFVAEADESDGTFLKYNYHAAVVTNIDTDHLAHFGSWENLKKGFQEFFAKAKTPRSLFYCIDDATLRSMNLQGVSYGFSEDAEYRIENFQQTDFRISFDLGPYKNIEVALTGKHNALNSASAFALALSLGVPEDKIREGMSTFPGVKRRMDKKGSVGEVLVLDDYAHHPTEIKVTLKAARNAAKERRLIAVYQPHRYSRMRYVMDELPGIFEQADIVVVTDLFTANEAPVEGVSTEHVLEILKKSHSIDIQYIPRKELVDGLHALVRPHDVVITMGAGDITKVGGDLVNKLTKEAPKKYRVGLLFGGMNCEHEISCRSAKNFVDNLNRDLYDLDCFKISLDGRFQRANQALEVVEEAASIMDAPVLQALLACDIFIPVLHGPYGEDGMVQGFLDTLQKPYVGCDVRACALAMDKALSKSIALQNAIATTPFVAFGAVEWQETQKAILSQIKEKVPFPAFVKPSHLGSSVGVAKVESVAELIEACDRAFQYDTHVVVEQGIVHPREIEFAVLGNARIEIPPPGEILADGKIYSYDAKYSPTGFAVTYAADLSDELIREGRLLAERIYRAIGCQGLSRVDFFLDQNNKYWFNELNPLPGFTSISLYPKIWANQMAPTKLMDSLLILALQRHREGQKIFRFSSQHLERA